VLVYLAEDKLPNAKKRLKSLADYRGLNLADLPLHAMTEDRIQIDRTKDQDRLRETLQQLKPKLLLLDPLVRISHIDENNAKEVSAVLGYLRGLQRKFDTSVALVHHARKPPPDGGRQGGIDLRGSSDLYAWVDSLIFVRKLEEVLNVKVEQRNARSIENFRLTFIEGEGGNRLEWSEALEDKKLVRKAKPSVRELVLKTLRAAPGSQNVHAIRERLLHHEKFKVTNENLRVSLDLMEEDGLLTKEGAGYLLV
jgi:hypothetical protein